MEILTIVVFVAFAFIWSCYISGLATPLAARPICGFRTRDGRICRKPASHAGNHQFRWS